MEPAPLTLLMAQLLFGLLPSLQLVGVSVDGFEDGLGHLLLPPLGDGEGEVAVQLLVTLQQLAGRERAASRGSGLPSAAPAALSPSAPLP